MLNISNNWHKHTAAMNTKYERKCNISITVHAHNWLTLTHETEHFYHKPWYLNHSGGDFEFFCPRSDTLHRWGRGAQKTLNFKDFFKILEYKWPTQTHPSYNLYEINRAYGQLPDRQCVKIYGDSLKGFRSYRGLKLRGSRFPEFSAPNSGETVHRIAKCFWGARTCSRSSITMSSFVGLGLHTTPGGPKTLSFLSVCLFVRHAVERQFVLTTSSRCRWSAETILMSLDRWRFVVVHQCSTFSIHHHVAPPEHVKV